MGTQRYWRKVMYGGLILGASFLTSQNSIATETSKGNATYYIQTDRPLGPSAEANDAAQPFFAAPSGANEVVEMVEELKDRVDKLEKRLKQLEDKADHLK